MKSKAKNTTPTPKPAYKLRRAAAPAVAVRHGTTAKARFATAEEAPPAGFAVLGALAAAPVTGKIKLETSSMTNSQLLTQLQRTAAGMSTTPAYSALPILTDVSSAANALGQQLTQLANLERDLREFRLALDPWVTTYAGVLNRAATACENADSTPATLTSGGWELRRAPGPPQVMPPPAGLGIVQTGFPGEGTARWSKVPNARYYELMVDPVPGAPLTLAQSVTLTSTTTRCPLPSVAPGSQLTICVRAVGAKGTGPFCDPLTVRVN